MRRSALLLALAAAAVGAVAPVHAGTGAPPSPVGAGNLLVNGGGEDGPAAQRVSDPAAPPPGWTTDGGFTQASYGAADFPDAEDASAVGGGRAFLAGGGGEESVTSARQSVDVTGASEAIDAGGVYASLRAAIGGFGQQGDYGTIDAQFLDEFGQQLGRIRVGPVTVDDRGGLPIGEFVGYGHTELLPVEGLSRVPPRTRRIDVVLTAVRLDGTFGDGYFDRVSLSLTPAPAIRPPALGRAVVVERASGRVVVNPPGRRPARRLTGPARVPVRTVIDARDGVVRMTSSANHLGALQTGRFSGGPFVVTQRASGRAFTVLTLRSRGLARECTSEAQPAAGGARAARSRRHRLFGRSRGHYRTRGRHSSATTRGTTWATEETCAGTATSVGQGKIDIHDFERDALVPIARGVEPENGSHDPPPPPPPPPCAADGTCPPPAPQGSAGPRRRASSSYVASGGRRR